MDVLIVAVQNACFCDKIYVYLLGFNLQFNHMMLWSKAPASYIEMRDLFLCQIIIWITL